jgi:large subunit ribosomal protein L21
MYAVIEIRGKQYKVEEGDILQIDRIENNPGDKLEFNEVLFVSDEKDVKVGTPIVEKAKVSGEVIGDLKGKKVISFKYKKRKNSSRKVGHRQKYTEVKITKIAV